MTRPSRSARFLTRWAGAVLVGVLPVIAPHLLPGQEPSAASPEAGKQLFETVCVACHTIGAGVRIGPDLLGITERRERAWLARFIRDPEQLFRERDSLATAILAQYGVRMPNLGLTEPQVESVIAHLGAAQAAATTAARPALYLPTLALALLAAAGITLLALTLGTKRVEIRA